MGGPSTARLSPLQVLGNKHVVVSGSFDLGATDVKASFDCDVPSTNVNTVVEATSAGLAGNSLTIATVADAALTKASLDLQTGGGCTNLDTVVEAHTAGTGGNSITIETVGDAALDAAELDFAAEGCTNLDTVIEFATGGTAGNAWKVNVFAGSGGGEGVNVNEDTTNHILTVMYETGVSTVANFETAIGTTTNFVVGTGGTGTNVLGAGDVVHQASMAGGTPQQSITVGSGAVVIHFEPGASTVADVEALIAALAGADDIVDVKTPGTGASVLASPDDVMAATNLASGADQQYAAVSGNDLTIHYESGATTVTNFEALITALAGSDDIIGIKTAGTGSNVLTAPGDTWAKTNGALAGGMATDSITAPKPGSQSFTVARTTTGTYTVTMKNKIATLISCAATLQLTTAADQYEINGTVSTSAGTMIFFVWDKSTGALADPPIAAGDRLNFVAVYENSMI
jgi:hypothetical protein